RIALLVRAFVILDDARDERLAASHGLVSGRVALDGNARIASDLHELLDGQRMAIELDHTRSISARSLRTPSTSSLRGMVVWPGPARSPSASRWRRGAPARREVGRRRSRRRRLESARRGTA